MERFNQEKGYSKSTLEWLAAWKKGLRPGIIYNQNYKDVKE